jgi:hypothetical protein
LPVEPKQTALSGGLLIWQPHAQSQVNLTKTLTHFVECRLAKISNLKQLIL